MMCIKTYFQYKAFIKMYQFNNSFRILLTIKVLFKHVDNIMYKSAIEHMDIKSGKSL